MEAPVEELVVQSGWKKKWGTLTHQSHHMSEPVPPQENLKFLESLASKYPKLFGDVTCRQANRKGEMKDYEPSQLCYVVVFFGVLDAVFSLAFRLKTSPLYAIGRVSIDIVSILVMQHHCNTCNAWAGFWKTLLLEIVGELFLRLMFSPPPNEPGMLTLKRKGTAAGASEQNAQGTLNAVNGTGEGGDSVIKFDAVA